LLNGRTYTKPQLTKHRILKYAQYYYDQNELSKKQMCDFKSKLKNNGIEVGKIDTFKIDLKEFEGQIVTKKQ